jgi:hypothetical protein
MTQRTRHWVFEAMATPPLLKMVRAPDQADSVDYPMPANSSCKNRLVATF